MKPWRVLVPVTALAVVIGSLASASVAATFVRSNALINHPGAGDAGADVSRVEAPSTIFGFTASAESGLRIADDFTVSDASWRISGIDTYAYQTNSTTTSTITAATLRIWDGQPDSTPADTGAKVIFGDPSTNRLESTAFANIFRVTEAQPLTTTTRPVMINRIAADVTLPAGTYWIDVQFTGSADLIGPFVPPVTVAGQPVTGNAVQIRMDGSVAPALDDTIAKGIPFVVHGVLDTVINGSVVTNPAAASATVAYAGTPPSRVTGFECRLDGAAFTPCPVGTVTLSAVSAGQHTISVRSVNGIGDADPTPVSIPFTMPPVPDVTAPVIRLTARRTQPAAKAIAVKATLSEAGTARLTGSILVKTRPGQKYALKPTVVSLTAGSATKLSVRMSTKTLLRIRSALNQGARVNVKIQGSAKDVAGNAAVRDAVRIRLVKRR